MFITDLFLSEAPIEDLSLVGDWSRNSSFRRPADRALLTSPKARAKIVHKWERTIVPFNVYFVNSPEAGRHIEVGEVGPDWLPNAMPSAAPQIKLRTDAVNIIYTNNSGEQWRPMTAWITAHRFAHAVKNLPEFLALRYLVHKTMKSILARAYRVAEPSDWDKKASYFGLMTKFAGMIGTFRSAREHKIRNEFEFVYELVAQYMTTGAVRFNAVPRSFGHGRMAWGRHVNFATISQGADAEADRQLATMAVEVTSTCERLLNACVGRIFVM